MKHCAYLVALALLCSDGSFANADDGKNSTVKKSGTGRIVGGYSVDIADYPYTVVVTASIPNANIMCGGIIIASNKVLTAAHCLYQQPITAITIRAGSTLRNSGGFLFNHLSYVVHDQYNSTTLANDVAVITIRGSFDGLANVGRIVLQNTEPVISSTNPTPCFVVGWGWINLNRQLADRLQRGDFVLMTQRTCATRLSPLTSTTICAQSLEGDACRGDSGGPLVCNGRLYGVVSYGPSNCNGAVPDGFAKITAPSIRSFITANAGV
ncbi:trypsin delta-like [Anopheles albimanus]|uniref:trypsin delta-like n=1 Tax=Anopheles albimanus TaxID=7167 RepID=UPI00164091DA|nr:trypsin delta-like [Anopheles albimanus]